ncbi:hypothetical protein [Paraburkholderia sp. MM5482-R1]|uniref:hypothetical protein n=1 Tax=unclassified Paraburkholderia TaxID=2615204 RepID=UPI003D1B6D07
MPDALFLGAGCVRQCGDQLNKQRALKMKRGKLLIGVAIVVTLAGCASPMIWNKYGASQTDYQQDSYACEKDARQSGYFGGGIAGAINMREFFKHCMVAHGWTLQS